MLARTRLRLVALHSIRDETQPFGPSCDDVGPIWTNCHGDMIDIYDSPAGWIGETLAEATNEAFPAIAIYTDRDRSVIQSRLETQLKTTVGLILEIYVCCDSEHGAEETMDTLHERVFYRLFRSRNVDIGGAMHKPILDLAPSQITVSNERTRGGDRILYMRQIEFTFEMTDCFSVPDCEAPDPICVDPVTTPATCGP